MLIKEALNYIKTYEPKPCNQKTYNGEKKVAIYLDYLNGVKQKDIAIKYGISHTRVHQIIRCCDKWISRLMRRN